VHPALSRAQERQRDSRLGDLRRKGVTGFTAQDQRRELGALARPQPQLETAAAPVIRGVATTTRPSKGWASATGFRGPNSDIQRRLVAQANAASGQSSGPSRILLSNGASSAWFTDVAGGDGKRMRDAMQIYQLWYVNRPQTRTLAQIKSSMRNPFTGSAYGSTTVTTRGPPDATIASRRTTRPLLTTSAFGGSASSGY